MTASSAAHRDPALQLLVDKWASPPKELIGKLPKAGQQLDYLGHADVCRALLEADLAWSWEPVATNEQGEPLIVVRDGTARMWIRLTVCGVTRLGVGTCPAATFDVEKQLVGDAIRNSAMRFGVALSLWSKADWDHVDAADPRTMLRGQIEALTPEQMEKLRGWCDEHDVPRIVSKMSDGQVGDCAQFLRSLG